MIYVTHDQVEAMTLADRIVVLRNGRIEQVGTPMELYERPQNTFVAQFIGSPKMNFFRSSDIDAGSRARFNHETTLGVRPEHLRICAQEPTLVSGRLELIEQFGEYALVHLITDEGTEFTVKLDLPAVRLRRKTNELRHLDRIDAYVRHEDRGKNTAARVPMRLTGGLIPSAL